MSYGLETYLSNGVKSLTIDDTMYLVLFTVLAPAGSSGFAPVPGLNPNISRAIVHPYSDAQVMIPHIVSLQTGAVYWSSGHPSWGCASMIIVVSTPL